MQPGCVPRGTRGSQSLGLRVLYQLHRGQGQALGMETSHSSVPQELPTPRASISWIGTKQEVFVPHSQVTKPGLLSTGVGHVSSPGPPQGRRSSPFIPLLRHRLCRPRPVHSPCGQLPIPAGPVHWPAGLPESGQPSPACVEPHSCIKCNYIMGRRLFPSPFSLEHFKALSDPTDSSHPRVLINCLLKEPFSREGKSGGGGPTQAFHPAPAQQDHPCDFSSSRITLDICGVTAGGGNEAQPSYML